MSGTTEGPGWPHDPTAAPPVEPVVLDEAPVELEDEEQPEVDAPPTDVDPKPRRRRTRSSE